MEQAFRAAAQAGTLKSLWLELTQKCNLSCGHCYVESGPGRELLGSMTTSDWLRIIDEASDLGCVQVQFIGGEPLLHPSVEELARRAGDRAMDVEILTNGTVLSQRSLAWMSEIGVAVSTSVYSACSADHDTVTKRRGSWQRTVSNIDRMIDGGLRVRAGVIYRNWEEDRVEDTLALLQKMGVMVGTDRVRSIGRGGTTDSYDAYLGELCGACGEERLCVTNTGDTFPCIMARQTLLGNARNDSLKAIIAGKALPTFKDALAMQPRQVACTPDCWPHGGCAPHDICNPQKRLNTNAAGNCTPDCWPHGGCAPHDLCNPHKSAPGNLTPAEAH